jgi:integrase
MASVTKIGRDGTRAVQFVDADGERRTMRLGRVTAKQAATFKARIEHLLNCRMLDTTPDRDTAGWLARLPDAMIERLAALGLTVQRPAMKLGDWLETYLADRSDLKPASLRKLEQTKAKLLGFFDQAIPLRLITTNDAADWRTWLTEQNIAEATVKQHTGNAKTMFTAAERRGLVAESPLRYLKAGATASTNTRYVTPEETDLILDACPSLEWRVVFGLARLAGLRTPSETHGLTLADIDWDRSRLRVRSPKTEHHKGHEQRVVPIVPQLMEILQAAFDAAEPGQERLVTKSRTNLRRGLRMIVDKTSVKQWQDTFQTLRRSCEKEWAGKYPQYAVSLWIGHSIVVSGKHYANDVPDELFDRAASERCKALHNAQQQASVLTEMSRKASQPTKVEMAANPVNCGGLRDNTTQCDAQEKGDRGDSNPRPTPENPEKYEHFR